MDKLCRVDSLQEGQSLGFEGVLKSRSQNVFAVNYKGVITVYLNQCPHLGVSLEFMENQFLSFDKSMILCSSHGALFEHGSGLCISGPCSGQHLTVIPHEVIDDWICINSDQSE